VTTTLEYANKYERTCSLLWIIILLDTYLELGIGANHFLIWLKYVYVPYDTWGIHGSSYSLESLLSKAPSRIFKTSTGVSEELRPWGRQPVPPKYRYRLGLQLLHDAKQKTSPFKSSSAETPVIFTISRQKETKLSRNVGNVYHFETGVITTIRGFIQKFSDWPLGAKTANGTALCHYVQLYRYFMSQTSEFCCHNPLKDTATSNTKGVYFVIDSVRKILDIPSHSESVFVLTVWCCQWSLQGPYSVSTEYSQIETSPAVAACRLPQCRLMNMGHRRIRNKGVRKRILNSSSCFAMPRKWSWRIKKKRCRGLLQGT